MLPESAVLILTTAILEISAIEGFAQVKVFYESRAKELIITG
jgi:hypothetical protein